LPAQLKQPPLVVAIAQQERAFLAQVFELELAGENLQLRLFHRQRQRVARRETLKCLVLGQQLLLALEARFGQLDLRIDLAQAKRKLDPIVQSPLERPNFALDRFLGRRRKRSHQQQNQREKESHRSISRVGRTGRFFHPSCG